MFLVLLRMAIGWHFLYEGVWKIESKDKGAKAFSAESYLRNATGPFAPRFRALVPDADSLRLLDPALLKQGWAEEVARIKTHFAFDPKQQADADRFLRDAEAKADTWFRDPENLQKVQKYRDDVARLRASEQRRGALSYERERAQEARKTLEDDRRELLATVDAWTGALREATIKLATPEQVERFGPYPPLRTQVDWINLVTMYGMVAVGLCLMLGLFSRLAALAAVAYLTLFYLSMPPWPGLPESPMTEGHYLIVNKNLIELIACLVLASTPTGLWIGLDNWLFGQSRRRRPEPSPEPIPIPVDYGLADQGRMPRKSKTR